jgi:hypothetical protein
MVDLSKISERVKVAASAIANARGMRRGVPEIYNILEILSDKLRDEVIEDAEEALAAADALGAEAERGSGTSA